MKFDRWFDCWSREYCEMLSAMEQCMPFIVATALKLEERFHVDRDDLVQTALLAIPGWLEKFDETRGTKFLTYCGGHIRWMMFDYCLRHYRNVRLNSYSRQHGGMPPEWSLETPIGEDQTLGDILAEKLAQPEEEGELTGEQRRMLEEVKATLKKMNALKAKVLLLRADGRTYAEIGEVTGRNPNYLRKIHDLGLKMVRKLVAS